MEEIEVLKNLVGFNTIKDNQNQEIIDYIENYLKKFGFKTESKTKNLVMSFGDSQELGFLGHTDTVEYISEFKNPFELTRKNDLLYGLGSCDMKGGISGFLDAISQIDLKKLKSGIKAYFTFDEEIGFSGIYELVENNEIFPKVMIFGEPTDNEILTGSKGVLEYKINFKGLKAHSSNPLKGISANMNSVKFLYELNEFYENDIKNEIIDMYEIPYTTMNVGIINGGSAVNSVSASCDVAIDFRIANKDHVNKINEKINKLAEKYSADVNIINSVEPFYDKIEFLGDTKTTNFITEASMIKNCKQRMILGVGPITAHEVNEHISVDSYRKLVEQYKEIIYKICM